MPEAPPRCRLRLCGHAELQIGAATHALAGTDALLLAWLCLQGATPRERLALLLWPDSSAEVARNALRQRLFRLHRQAGFTLVVGTQRLALADGVAHDLDTDSSTWASSGDAQLLAGLPAPASGELGNWLAEQRQLRRQRWRQACEARIDALQAQGELADALTLAGALVQEEPLSEDAHRRVMRLHYLRGDRAAALLAFDACEAMLKHEVGARPSAETLALLRLVQPGGADDPAATADTIDTGLAAPPRLPTSLLRPPRLVGRQLELAALHDGWRSGSLLLVLGEAGIGKSRLLQALVGEGQQAPAEATVLHATGRPGDGLVPYATLARLLSPLAQRLSGALDGPTRRGLGAILPLLAEEGTIHTRAPRGASLLPPVRALLEIGASSCQTIVLDDLHFADAASVQLLQGLLTPPRGQALPQRWCLGLRPPEAGGAQQALLDALAAAGPCTQLRLQPLTQGQVAELLASLQLSGLGEARARELAPLVRQRSGGNPLFVLETLKFAWGKGQLGPVAARTPGGAPGQALAAHELTLPSPQSLQQLIAQQLARLSREALALARLAAIAGVDFSLDLAEQVLASTALQLADPWHELETQQVLVGEAFAHDLIYEAVLDGLPALIARRLHGQVALALEAQAARAAVHPGTSGKPADPARLADHWERAGDSARALPHLRDAADRAHGALREHERIGFLLRAADIAEQRGELDAAFAHVSTAVNSHMNTIRHAGGFVLLTRLDALARSPAQQAQAAGQRAWYCMQLADVSGALEHGQRALALAHTLAEPFPAFVTGHRLATALAAAGRFDEALQRFEAAAQALQQWPAATPPQDQDLAEFHGNHAAVLDNLGRLAAAATQRRLAIAAAARAGDAAQQVTQLANQAVSQHSAGEVTEMHDSLAQAERLIASFDMQGSTVGFVAVLRSQADRARGHFAGALRAADEAERVLNASNPARLPVVHLQRGHIWLDLGQTARAVQALQAAASGLPPHLEARRCVLMARAVAQTPGASAAWLERAEAVLPSAGWPEIALLVPLARTRELDASQALPALLALQARAAEHLLRGVERSAQLLIFERLLAQPEPSGRAAHAALARQATVVALDLLAQPLASSTSVAALDYALALPWRAASWLAAQGMAAEAQALHQRLRGWVQACAANDVPAPFRASFEQRNAVNRALLTGGD